MAEYVCADLAEACIHAHSCTSFKGITNGIATCLAEHNDDLKPYRWKSGGEKIFAKVHRARKVRGGTSNVV
ncbi:MAG: hypothetical protein OXN89_07740 [Bryobacterales bacterium]|nr:hypothetical protein [Bryobacterales bacterium]